MRVDTVQNIAKSADKIIVLTDSEKFSERGVSKLFDPEQVYMVYTDSNVSPKAVEQMEDKGIIVKIAEL